MATGASPSAARPLERPAYTAEYIVPSRMVLVAVVAIRRLRELRAEDSDLDVIVADDIVT
jgi:hypothetical protein